MKKQTKKATKTTTMTLEARIKHCTNQFRLAGKQFDWGSCDIWDTELKEAQKLLSELTK